MDRDPSLPGQRAQLGNLILPHAQVEPLRAWNGGPGATLAAAISTCGPGVLPAGASASDGLSRRRNPGTSYSWLNHLQVGMADMLSDGIMKQFPAKFQ